MTTARRSIDTDAVHAGEPEPRIAGAVSMPVFQSANYLHGDTDGYFATRYSRLSNGPNHDALHAKLAALEDGDAALVTASGMAAISTALLSTLGAGDHLLVLDAPYGGTRTFITDELPRFGIEHTFIDGRDPGSWARGLRPTTRVIYVEAITNPMMIVPDLGAAVRFAREHGLVSMIDNTFATPVNFRPLPFGFDLSLHSATKYLGGHSDVIAGAAIGGRELLLRMTHLLGHLGGSLDPHACMLLHRGLKTLPLRVRRHNASALTIARALAAHPAVTAVHYPGLETTAGHADAAELFAGYGGMLSLELTGGAAAADRFVERLSLPIHAASLGGVETLIIRPAATAYAGVDRAERERLGVTEGLLRVSVGLEDPDELLADLRQALDHVAASAA